MLAKVEFPQQILSNKVYEVLQEIVGEDKLSMERMMRHKETGAEEVNYSWSKEKYESGDYEDVESKVFLTSYGEYVVDLVRIAREAPTVKHTVIKLYQDEYTKEMNAIEASLNKMISSLSRFDKQMEFNDRCEIHVANLGLLSINETMLLEDSCTDALQEKLDAGWRIISIAPQPDQRRPDYILGRFNPDHRPEGRALRG